MKSKKKNWFGEVKYDDEDEDLPICNYPIDIDQPKMEKHIVDTAIKNDIFWIMMNWAIYWMPN